MIVPVDGDRCAECGSLLVREVLRQDALVRHGGYGGTERTESDVCPACGFTRVVGVQNERPPRADD